MAKEPEATTAKMKIVQYLTEAHGKEKELETALASHIEMAKRPAYKKRLKTHLRETRQHSKLLERRIKKLGGGGVAAKATELVSRGVATAKGPLHAIRGGSDEERELKNAKTEYSEEHEEIATYLAIEAFAEEVGDPETAKLAKAIRRDEERMAKFLERQIPIMTRAVAKAEVPASERPTATKARSNRKASKKKR